MSTQEPTSIRALLEQQTLFKDLAPAHLDLLAQVAMKKTFAADEIIFRQGDPANRFYVIIEGEVAIEDQQESKRVLVQKIGANDVLGWSWLFPPFYWHFDARALCETQAIFFYGTWLRETCETSPDFGYQMMKQMSSVMIERLQRTRRQLVANDVPGI